MNLNPTNIAVSDNQKRLESQRGAWKILMNACQENGIDTISFANIIGISHGQALMFFKQGYLQNIGFSDEQYERLARATRRTPHFWKSLFTV